MQEIKLKYGCNPNQAPAFIDRADGGPLPTQVLNGAPGYINFMDALNAWQLVKSLREATGLPAAASFKHVSPAGAALGLPLCDDLKLSYQVADIEGLDDSPLALAYARARGADRLSSFGDFIALSDTCDITTARLIAREVSDGIIAPGYDKEALALLSQKRKGAYSVIQIDGDYMPPEMEHREIFGLRLSQRYNDALIDARLLQRIVTQRKDIPEGAARDLLLCLITLKYTQSNSVCLAFDGQAIGIGAGQQSRVHCVRLACQKADLWQLRRHEKVLDLPFLKEVKRVDRDNAVEAYLLEGEKAFGEERWKAFFTEEPRYLTADEKRQWLSDQRGVSLGSDAFFPFDDSIIRAYASGVDYVAQPGGSVRDDQVIARCDALNMAMAFTGLRLFHH